jgi:hypothetical protein
MAQLQHNMFVVASRNAVLSVISGGGKWVEIKTYADPFYQHLIVTAERKFSRRVEAGELPGHHREVHRSGDEAAWRRIAAIDPSVVARLLWLETHPALPSARDREVVSRLAG